MSASALRKIRREVPSCTRCPRLVAYLEQQRERYADYWNRPVPGFGDPAARLVIVGLAPGLHGANRSGRPFWLDASGEWLYRELEARGLWDGDRLSGAHIGLQMDGPDPGSRRSASLCQSMPPLGEVQK